MKPTEATVGAPCWVELGTDDVAESGRFYSGLFGWQVETDPREEAGGYTMCSLDGVPVAAMSPLYAPGQPVAWTVSFAVADADTTAVRAGDQGGTLIMAPMDVFDSGRFSVLQDPAGALFCIWQPGTFQGFGLWDEPNAACRVELLTRDVPAASAFYRSVLGWSVGTGDHPRLSAGDRQFGNFHDLNRSPTPAEVPAHWLPSFGIEDTAAATRKAASLGAQIVNGPFELPGTGHLAVLLDPRGAVFGLCQAR